MGSAGFSLAILPFALVNIRLENVSQYLWFEGWFELEEEVVQGGLGWVGGRRDLEAPVSLSY